jgi:predicted nuclease with TOPRIM domain
MEKDHLEIILEDMQGKFDLLIEGHEGLRQELRATRQEVNERLDCVNFKIGVLNKKIDDVENRLSARIDGVENNLSAKIDGVAAGLAHHRRDTESHPNLYKIKEND